MTQYGFYFDATRCTGCKTCEAICRDVNRLELGSTYRRVWEIEGGSWTEGEGGVWSTDSYTYYVSVACNHCDSPACVHVCPTGAMRKDDDGIVSVDAKRCIGCGYCALACPYGAPHVDRALGHSVKCDACASRRAEGKEPACVEGCTQRALFFGPVDEIEQGDGRAAVAPLPDPSETEPNLYILKCANMQPAGSTDCRVANAAEVK